MKALKSIYGVSLDKMFGTAKAAALHAGAAIFNMNLSLIRAIAYVQWRDRQETAFPVVYPFVEKLAPDSALSKSQQAIAVILFVEQRPDEDTKGATRLP